VRFIREQLAALEPGSCPVLLALSARQALEARERGEVVPAPFGDFEHVLRARLIDRKTAILAERALALAQRALDLIVLRVEAQRRAERLTLEDLDQAIERFRAGAGDVRRRTAEAAVLLRHDIAAIHRTELGELASRTRERLSRELWPRVEHELQARSGEKLRAVIGPLASSIGKWVVEELRPYHQGTEQFVPARFAAVVGQYAARIRAAAEEVVALARQSLGMAAAIPEIDVPLADEARFYFQDWDYAGGPLRGPAWRLRLPRRWAEPAARQMLRELLERRIHQNLEAIRYDWMTRLEDAVRRFHVQSGDQLDSIIDSIEEALARARELRAATAVEQARSSARLDVQQWELQAIRQHLERIAGAREAEPDGPPEQR
jgi:hypothetical protein